MNPSDSKKLEEIEKRLEEWNIAYTDYRPFKKERCDDVLMEDAEPDVIRLIFKVEEQDKRNKFLEKCIRQSEHHNDLLLQDGKKLDAKVKEQDREIEELRMVAERLKEKGK